MTNPPAPNKTLQALKNTLKAKRDLDDAPFKEASAKYVAVDVPLQYVSSRVEMVIALTLGLKPFWAYYNKKRIKDMFDSGLKNNGFTYPFYSGYRSVKPTAENHIDRDSYWGKKSHFYLDSEVIPIFSIGGFFFTHYTFLMRNLGFAIGTALASIWTVPAYLGIKTLYGIRKGYHYLRYKWHASGVSSKEAATLWVRGELGELDQEDLYVLAKHIKPLDLLRANMEVALFRSIPGYEQHGNQLQLKPEVIDQYLADRKEQLTARQFETERHVHNTMGEFMRAFEKPVPRTEIDKKITDVVNDLSHEDVKAVIEDVIQEAVDKGANVNQTQQLSSQSTMLAAMERSASNQRLGPSAQAKVVAASQLRQQLSRHQIVNLLKIIYSYQTGKTRHAGVTSSPQTRTYMQLK